MMGKKVLVISKSLGLNTVLDPFQAVDLESGSRFLSKAVNVRVTDSNLVERSNFTRTLLSLTNGHSLFCDTGSCLVHQGGVMYEVASDLTLSAAKRSGMSGDKISHTQAGDAIYFSNLSENGVYYNGTALSWAVDTYIGPETNRFFIDHVPFFSKIAYFNGYMLGSIGNALYVSELGLLGCWEMKPVWMSNSTIIMIKPVVTDSVPPSGGVFVSDGSRITYLGGLAPRNFAEPRVTNYPALEWAVAHNLVDGSLFGEKSGLCAAFQTTKGLCLGYPDGTLVNVIQGNINVPAGFVSGATLIDKHNIISTLR